MGSVAAEGLSIKDFAGADKLLDALNDSLALPGVMKHASTDWVLSRYDPATQEPCSLKAEFHRLQALQSYDILDGDDEALDRLTMIGAALFDAPFALITLVDVGRIWFLSSSGKLGKGIPRKDSLCGHALQSFSKTFIVPDTTKDFRFFDSAIVTGGPMLRFYGAAALETPEGYRLGNFCILDTKPRPAGFNQDQQDRLVDLAQTAMRILVDRRERKRSQMNHEQLIARTAHDLITPLSGLQLSLSVLKEDGNINTKLDKHQRDLIHTACSCADVMSRFCQTAIKDLRSDCLYEPETRDQISDLFQLDEFVRLLKQVRQRRGLSD